MSTSSAPTTTDRLLGLLIISGFMLLITAIPLGIFLSLQERYKFGSDWHWAITQGAVMAIATAIVGGLFTGVGEFIVRRRWKAQERMTHK
jgi:hypothetical protein